MKMSATLEKIRNHGETSAIVDIRGIKIGVRLLTGNEYLAAATECVAAAKESVFQHGGDISHRLMLDLMIRELMTQVITRAAFDPETKLPVFSSATQVRSEIIRPDRNKLIDRYQTLEQQFQASQRL